MTWATKNTWTPEMEESLRKLYPKASWAELMAAIPKSRSAISKRANTLKIRRDIVPAQKDRLTTDPFILELRARRIKLGIPLRRLAQRCGYENDTIQKVEKGISRPSYSLLLAWTEVLGVSMTTKLSGEPLLKRKPHHMIGVRRYRTPFHKQAALDMAAVKRRNAIDHEAP